MSPPVHIAVSAGVGYLVGRFFHSTPAFFMTFIGGVFVDVDHFLDYFLNYSVKFDLKDMYFKLSRTILDRIYVVLHSYEIVICLWIYITLFNPGVLWIAFATGYSLHMVLDQLANPLKFQGYFLLYRLYRRFDKGCLIKKAD